MVSTHSEGWATFVLCVQIKLILSVTFCGTLMPARLMNLLYRGLLLVWYGTPYVFCDLLSFASYSVLSLEKVFYLVSKTNKDWWNVR